MSDNGHHNPDWLDLTVAYAALAEAEDCEQARRLLEDAGVQLSARSLQRLRERRPERVQRLRHSGLAPALLGPEARRRRRLLRLDALLACFEERIRTEPVGLDRELAAVLQQYRELFELLSRLDQAPSPPDPSNTEAAGEIGAAVTLLEALDDGQSPPEDFAGAVFDAARRLVAASGGAFPPLEPDLPGGEPDPAGL